MTILNVVGKKRGSKFPSYTSLQTYRITILMRRNKIGNMHFEQAPLLWEW
jgi:hypothetical protein